MHRDRKDLAFGFVGACLKHASLHSASKSLLPADSEGTAKRKNTPKSFKPNKLLAALSLSLHVPESGFKQVPLITSALGPTYLPFRHLDP